MSDPARLMESDLSDSASVCERDLLRSLRPSGAARKAVWQRIVGQGALAATVTAAAGTASLEALAATEVVGAAAVGQGTGTATAVSLTSSLAAKAGVALLVAAPVVGGGIYFSGALPASEPAQVQAAREQPPVVAPAVAPPLVERPVVAESEPPRAEPSNLGSTAADPDALRQENQLLREARAQERAGNPQGALRLLADLDRRFARGALLQEREVLRIQALFASGSATTAKTRAERFLERYPNSPYAAHVRATVEARGGL